MRSVTSNQDYKQYYRGSESVIHGPKGISFFGSAFVMMLIALVATLYISSYLFPLMVVARSFYIPLLMGVAVPAAVIGGLILLLSGSILFSVILLVAVFLIVTLVAGISGSREG